MGSSPGNSWATRDDVEAVRHQTQTYLVGVAAHEEPPNRDEDHLGLEGL